MPGSRASMMAGVSKGHQIGRTSEGYDEARSAWQRGHGQAFTIEEAAELCRECHRLAPFLFLNGNTFVAIARETLISHLHLSGMELAVARGAIGHFIAGSIGMEELKAALHPTERPEE